MATPTEAPRFLLLLPPVPSLDCKTLKTGVFGDTVTQVLREVAQHTSETEQATILDVAVACPQLVKHSGDDGGTSFAVAQELLACIYTLIGIIATRDDVNIEDSRGVDVRVILVAWSPEQDFTSTRPFGPVVSLQTLAGSGRQWQYAFGVEDASGEAFVKAFVTARSQGSREDESRTVSDRGLGGGHRAFGGHSDVAVGGTFDHLHIGHKLLLTMTLLAASEGEDDSGRRSATIGITGDQLLVKKKHAEVLQSWELRQRTVQGFVDGIINFSASKPQTTERDEAGPNGKSVDLHYPHGLTVKCTEIQDPFGPTITEEGISALIISAETRAGGKAVNDKRQEKGWKALEVFEVDVLHTDENSEEQAEFAGKISSTQIRAKVAHAQSTAAP